MVAYVPPQEVLASIGASFRSEPLLCVGRRLVEALERDRVELARLGVTEEDLENLDNGIRDLENMLQDKQAARHDTPPQMTKVCETMAEVRAWLRSLRRLAAIHLAADTPALMRVSSPSPELVEMYPRDLLEELRRRLKAAEDLKPRVEACGVDDAFIKRGRKLERTLSTAIGPTDLDPKNLSMVVRRVYLRKGQLVLLALRLVRAGRAVFAEDPGRREAYRLDELDPKVLDTSYLERPAKSSS
jgi:hypothetical protein